MDEELYAVVAAAARYLFAALAIYIVFKGWRADVTDGRRGRLVRGTAPDLDAIGELLVLADAPGGKLVGQRYPLPREGALGSSHAADVRLQRPGVRRRHLWIERRVGCVAISPVGGAPVAARGEPPYVLRDGDTFSIEGLEMMVVLFDAAESAPDGPADGEAKWREDGESDGKRGR
ncbi:MAG: FHA domain-containing protein [Clostridiales bacterium]|nr:FHA domain-containing protein [Clostridiales bacterium]